MNPNLTQHHLTNESSRSPHPTSHPYFLPTLPLTYPATNLPYPATNLPFSTHATLEYDDDLSPEDPHIVAFWHVWESEFSEEEKSAFLRFVWARPTLPPKGWW